MSSPHSYTLNTSARPTSALENGDDDDDDICPVCESECTCHNRRTPVSSSRNAAPTPTSTSTFITFSQPKDLRAQPSGPLPSLKIKLTVPPKFRKDGAAVAHSNTAAPIPRSATISHISDSPVPKRRGRPPKALVAAREAAKAALVATHSGTSDYSHPTPLRSPFVSTSSASAVIKSQSKPLNKKALPSLNGKKKSHGRGATVQTASSLSSLSDSDEDVQFPTFMSAASSSSLTSSSEESEIDSDGLSSGSDLEEEERFILQAEHDKARVKKEGFGSDPSHKRRTDPPNNRWEIKPRKKSVGVGDSDTEDDSNDSSEEDEEADDEDDGEADEDDEAMGVDAEEEALAGGDREPDADEDDGKLGVSFDGLPSGWSEDDEESSFDAEVFFANLDGDSDSDVSPAALHGGFATEDDSFSADEEDALLLMDVDPSTQIRRISGGFEIGVDLDSVSLGLDGGLLPSPFGPFDGDMSFNGSTESDVEMTVSGEDETDSLSDELALVETDGETTEDELVDSDGLPNSRAMLMFRWPSSVSTVNPQSTVSPGSLASPPVTPLHASQTMRIALASMTAQRCSPAPTPADILSGKISMDDLDDIEIAGDVHNVRSSRSSSRHTATPCMGQFITSPVTSERRAIVDGTGSFTPSPFPRSRVLRAKRGRTFLYRTVAGLDLSTDAEGYDLQPSGTPQSLPSVHATSSDEPGAQSFIQGSDEPPSTDVIELDDVLDASMLDSEPTFDSDDPFQDPLSTPKTPVNGTHMRSLNRWDRIPVATFRRTRETTLLESTPASDNGVSTRFASIAVLNNDMLGTPKTTSKSKTSSKRRSKEKSAANLLLISPLLMPVRDGDRTPTNAGPSNHPLLQQQDPLHQQRLRRDQRKEKAMLKKKLMGKYAHSPNRPQRHRPHFPNSKNRSSGSMQRTQFFASSSHVPHLNL
ncbi:hypothetical protein BDW22DRAFT_1235367 [Trametopsis cervina]|nr:hypothetical protein BDW22DRAFT_1235367 [Trametopsis cervina]